MTRKQLPKAIKRDGADLRMIAAEALPEMPAPARAAPKEQAEIEVWPPAPPPANDPLPVAFSLSQSQAEMRLREAFRIVERHKLYAGLGGLVPMPAVNVASVTAVILRMVKVLTDLYGVPFERDKTRSIVIGLMAGAAPTGLAAATTSTLAFVVAPIAGPVGLAVSTVTAASLTRRIGLSFIERFEQDAAGQT
jgi:uncharacterized protein (DUF697 family)